MPTAYMFLMIMFFMLLKSQVETEFIRIFRMRKDRFTLILQVTK